MITLIKDSLLKLKKNSEIIHLENNTIYLNNIKELTKIIDTEVIIKTNTSNINLFGTNFKVLKMLDSELLLEGNITNFEKQNNS